MIKLEELERKFKKYRRRYQKLLKTDKAASSRYGDEFRDIQLWVLESAIFEIKKEIMLLKRNKQKRI